MPYRRLLSTETKRNINLKAYDGLGIKHLQIVLRKSYLYLFLPDIPFHKFVNPQDTV